MDWVDTTDDSVDAASALRQAFEIIRPVPTQATARVQKVQSGKGKDKHQALLQGKLHLVSHPLMAKACIQQHLDLVMQRTYYKPFPQSSQTNQWTSGHCGKRHTTNAGQL